MSDFKNGQSVKAASVRSNDYRAGKIINVRSTAKGNWYEVKLDDGTIFCTRAAKIKAA